MSVTTRPAGELGALLEAIDPDRELPPCGLRQLTLGSDAIRSVADTVTSLLDSSTGRGRPEVCLLVDATPILRTGEDLKELILRQLQERFVVRQAVLDDGESELHVTDQVVERATQAARGADAVVAVGGGTISDIGKLAALGAAGEPRPALVSVQTAASVDGYTDDVSVVLRDGVKRTVPSRWPDAVVADAQTIAQAPPAMNRAGFGEMTSMLVAPADWRLANLLGLDHTFHPGPIRLLAEVGSDIDVWSPGVKRGDPDAVARLTRALALRGVATGVAGTTAVLSGVEHLISHMLDQHHAQHHAPMGLHGAQVGVASVVSACAWEVLFDRMAATTAHIREEALDQARAQTRVQQAFAALDPSGRLAEECWRDYSRKVQATREGRAAVEQALAGWASHAPELRALVRSSREIAVGLVAAGSAVSFDELDPQISPALARWAIGNCALMRNRFTVVDLLDLLGWWGDADIAEVLARTAAAVDSAREVALR